VLYGGSLQPTEGAPILLACALLLESRELRAMDVAAVCTNLLLVVASSRLEEGVLVQVGPGRQRGSLADPWCRWLHAGRGPYKP
jgi:hypothetical protein